MLARGLRGLNGYLLPPDSEQLGNFVNYWLQLKSTDGSEQRERDYWNKRLPRENASPRWSILHNVMGVSSKQ